MNILFENPPIKTEKSANIFFWSTAGAFVRQIKKDTMK